VDRYAGIINYETMALTEPSSTAAVVKDMWVANLVEPWRGDSNGIPAQEFFESINEAAELGRLSAKDKVRIVRLKLRGPAKLFYSTQPRLEEDGVDFAVFQAVSTERFRVKQTDQFNYVRLQNSPQGKEESPEAYLDRLRKLCHRTISKADTPEEQIVLNREAERRLLAAFIDGLRGAPGKHVRLQMPDAIDRAPRQRVTNCETTERTGELWGHRQEARGNYKGTRYESQWSRNRGWNSGDRRTGFEALRIEGCRTDCQTAVSRVGPTKAGTRREQASGPKDGDDHRTRRNESGGQGIQCYSCGGYGHYGQDCRAGRKGRPRGFP
jgi:hypothetical protein